MGGGIAVGRVRSSGYVGARVWMQADVPPRWDGHGRTLPARRWSEAALAVASSRFNLARFGSARPVENVVADLLAESAEFGELWCNQKVSRCVSGDEDDPDVAGGARSVRLSDAGIL